MTMVPMYVEAYPDEGEIVDLHYRFAETELGQTLAANVRYGPFRPPEVSHERWIELLGPDVDNLAHMLDTYYLTRRFISHTDRLTPGELGSRDKALLSIGAITHDRAESITTDINYLEKTTDDEVEEYAVFEDHFDELTVGCSKEVKELVKESMERVIFSSDDRLSKMFNSIERIGYIRTGLRAADHARNETAPDCENNLRWLSASVLSTHHTSHLISASHGFAAVRHFLDSHWPVINHAFIAADSRVFNDFWPLEKAALRSSCLKDSHEIWSSWLDAAVILPGRAE